MRIKNNFSCLCTGILSLYLLSPNLQAANPEVKKPEIVAKTASTQSAAEKTTQHNAKTTTGINLNTADAQTLSKSIKGIGIKRAESIIKYREAHNGFKAVTELSLVPLIGKNFVNKHMQEIEDTFTVN